jgi:CHAD domain-containing protein
MTVATTATTTPTRRRTRPLTAAALNLPDEPRTASPQDSLTAHLRATVDTSLRVLLKEQATAGQADEPESVHQMRVAARRARVALRMDRGGIGPATESLRTELAWLGTRLGDVRDLDVLCERLAGEGADLPETDLPAFGDVLSQLLANRSAAAELLVKALDQQRYRSLLRAMAAETTSQADDGALTNPDKLLVNPVKALHLQLAAAAQSPSDVAWHELRIKTKRVRYAAELASRLATGRRARALTELAAQAKALQELLGTFNDTVVTEHHLRRLAATRSSELSPSALLVVGRLVERQVAKREELRELLPEASSDLYQATNR